MSRQTANHLKNCEFSVESLDVGALYIEGFLTHRLNSDFPVKDHPHYYGDPTFFSLDSAARHGKPSRLRGHSKEFVLGGMHMTHYGYVPFQLIKRITCTECGFHDADAMDYFSGVVKNGDILELEKILARTAINNIMRNHTHEIAGMPESSDMPWFLGCNPERFPRWYGNHDARLDLTEKDVDFQC